jgi:tripartite-type tricarboxylate transporter receptor subunit TctC
MWRILAAFVAGCAAASTAGTASAQDYPSRPVHLVVPYTPGTGADILARLVGTKLAERWKTAVITDNRPGATGNIGADLVAKSPPDGYAVLFAATSFAANPAMTRTPYDPEKSFAPVALVATSSLAVLVYPQLPARNMREFVELAKAQPGKLHYASPGAGGVQHLAMELIKLETGIDVVHVPYKGLGGALSDTVAGHVQATVSALQSAAPHVQSGRLRMLAVLSSERAAAFPDVPTLKEQGLPDLEIDTWYAAFVPAGTPAAVIQKLNAGINDSLNDFSIKASLEKQGMTPAGGDPARLELLLKKELARWARVVNASGIKAD